jgi:hypothetical protein
VLLDFQTSTVTDITYRSDWYVPGIFVHSSSTKESY